MINEENAIIPKDAKKYNDILQMAADFDEDEIVMRPGCKMCHSDFRHEAEAFWEKSNFNYNATVKFLEGKNEKISFRAVKRHLDKHYTSQIKAIKMKDYAEDLAKYMAVQDDAMKTIQLCRGILKKELMEMAMEGATLPLEAQWKNTEVVNKVIAQLLACDEAERKHHEEWGPVHILLERLTQIVENERTTILSPEYQERLSNVVKTITSEIEGGILEKKRK